MNERLRELVRQAGLDDSDFPIEDWDNVPLAKFAELIVRECRDIIGKTRDQAIEDEWNVDEAMSTAMFDIEQHLGVHND